MSTVIKGPGETDLTAVTMANKILHGHLSYVCRCGECVRMSGAMIAYAAVRPVAPIEITSAFRERCAQAVIDKRLKGGVTAYDVVDTVLAILGKSVEVDGSDHSQCQRCGTRDVPVRGTCGVCGGVMSVRSSEESGR
jgi:ribosomal protein L37E